ncbi:PadR family transcriptional regulator [Candidatus Woesearchaeota archaeon]|nr:PadR family transcriptional regulator [Candidatus Woesearchaeota archaeon]
MADIKVTNMVKFYTLSLLAAGPKHGYELLKELEGRLGRKMSASHVYPFLNSLKQKRLVTINRRGGREKKVYQLTPNGKAFTRRMFVKFGDLISLAIEPKLTICMQCGCKVYEGGHEESVGGKAMKFCCQYCARSYRSRH